MKLKYEMSAMEMDGEIMAVPINCEENFRGILRMNGTTADILEYLKTDTTEDAIVAAMLREYRAEEADIRESVELVLKKLRESKLLEE